MGGVCMACGLTGSRGRQVIVSHDGDVLAILVDDVIIARGSQMLLTRQVMAWLHDLRIEADTCLLVHVGVSRAKSRLALWLAPGVGACAKSFAITREPWACASARCLWRTGGLGRGIAKSVL